MKLGWFKGLHIRTAETNLIIDPTTSRLPKDAFVFISHAHSDHTKGFNSPNIKFSTHETKKIFESITGRKVNNSRNLSINSYVKIDDLKIESLNSGHMIGASQYRITSPEKVILYTGDLNYVNSLVVEAAEPRECDVLIIEATYGDPLYNFPPKINVYSDIIGWTLNELKGGRTPCFRVYAAGKAQEIVKLFTQYTKIPIICDDRIHSVNEICNNSFLNLRWKKTEYEPDNILEPLIFFTSRRSYRYSKFSEARATGWALKMRNSRVQTFPLSGHADFSNLNRYVQETKAKKVYVFTGFMKEFSDYLRRKGFNAEPIPPLIDRDLYDFI